MRAFLRKHLSTIVVGMIAGAIGSGGPAIAATVADFARNADKVDGRHAVGAGATLENRKGKLVATNSAGRLPNNIIGKAPNADKLDGINSTGFLRSGARAANSDKLDGLDSTQFLRSDGKAADSDRLDGLDSTQFLRSDGKAADSDKLDGLDSSAFMSSDDAWAYVVGHSGGAYFHATSGNLTVSRVGLGEYCVVVPARGSHKAAQVTLADPGGTKIVSVGTGHGSGCNPLHTSTHYAVPVYIRTTSGAAVDGLFTIVIPAP